MARGGARANSGPEPDPFSLRTAQRRAAGQSLGPGWVVLPVVARPGDPPPWPLPGQTGREAELWAGLWTKPQAAEWERLGQDHQVAMYVRRLTEVEQPGASASLGGLLIRLADGLGLTLAGMRQLKWQLGAQDGPPAPVVPIRERDGGSVKERFSARDRIPRANPFSTPEQEIH